MALLYLYLYYNYLCTLKGENYLRVSVRSTDSKQSTILDIVHGDQASFLHNSVVTAGTTSTTLLFSMLLTGMAIKNVMTKTAISHKYFNILRFLIF